MDTPLKRQLPPALKRWFLHHQRTGNSWVSVFVFPADWFLLFHFNFFHLYELTSCLHSFLWGVLEMNSKHFISWLKWRQLIVWVILIIFSWPLWNYKCNRRLFSWRNTISWGHLQGWLTIFTVTQMETSGDVSHHLGPCTRGHGSVHWEEAQWRILMALSWKCGPDKGRSFLTHSLRVVNLESVFSGWRRMKRRGFLFCCGGLWRKDEYLGCGKAKSPYSLSLSFSLST